MRIESSVTSISWIPSESMTGLMRVPFDVGVGHYDPPPPDLVDDEALDSLRDGDSFRFANRLEAWIEVEGGKVVDAGYSGRAIVGSTTIRFGVGSVTIPAAAYPVLREDPLIGEESARFTQTAGGSTGVPFPHRIQHPPYLSISPPTAWTTLGLEIAVDGSSRRGVAGASPFPRHWIYDEKGRLTEKSGLIDFGEWTRVHDHHHSPWHGEQREALVAEAHSAAERELSGQVMAAGAVVKRLRPRERLTRQGETDDRVYLILDGLLHVEVEGRVLAEIGPGAIVGERAVLESGARTATVRAVTAVKAAAVQGSALDVDALSTVAGAHRREEE